MVFRAIRPVGGHQNWHYMLCLTQENKNKPWILFEAGALAKGLSSSRVCTFLIDLDPADVANPLAQFNHTFYNRDGVFDLLRTINSLLGDRALKESVLEKVFDTYWEQFETSFKAALEEHPQTEPVEERSEESMLVEMLSAIRRLDRKVRDIDSRPIDPFAAPSHNKRNKERFGAREADKLVRELIESDAPNGIIEDMLEERGVPTRIARRMIQEIREEYEIIGATDPKS